ncbi:MULTISPECIES: pantoate--beta-alanine ligase [Bizionia]|uniref:Pantothenate synthetase n=1 Tax=Bizionia algoritergicola TaxID=291187 RepID=A0A5D0R1R0_9FLAO|nr:MULTISPECIES: pantoate--beta-alanine ligase [Bizionia]OBX23541.1 pantoate--beta-alanine ligase [Bizionia sp. APA-3]TYB74925.1 pantoate--beta-alanine ligase [Bizionia algoritergicola]
MIVFTEKKQIEKHLQGLKDQQFSIGFVPTMGALHQGHLSLVSEALQQNNCVVVSIFVNPTQFDNATDLNNYPRTLTRDTELLETVSSQIIIYAPDVSDIYEAETKAEHFSFDGLEFEMEGRFRDGHFDGVGTIVKRLFEIVKPDHAYFGQKDFQQLAIIKKLVEKHQIPVTIHGCPIQRGTDGLALSSRNERLKPDYKIAAPFIYKTLKDAKKQFGTKSAKYVTEWVENAFSNHDLLQLEYFIIADEETLKPVSKKSETKSYRAFIAVYADDIRLIDNIALN